VFPQELYCLEHKTPSYLENKTDYIESSLDPDFRFRCRQSQYVFWVEAKYRSGWQGQDPSLEWCRPDQLLRYRQCNNQQPVFLCLGVGGTPSKPKALCLLPINNIKSTYVDDLSLEKYVMYPDKAMLSGYLLWLRMRPL
jgi:hypothetical protein